MKEIFKYVSITESFSKKYSLLVFTLVLINSQILFATMANPIGIKGFLEVFYIFLLVMSSHYVISKTYVRRLVKLDFLVYALIIVMWVYSAIASYFQYGQPLIYGLIEERRILGFLIYFPCVYILRKALYSVEDILNFMLVSAVICSVLSILSYFGMIPVINESPFGDFALRQNRYLIGVLYILLGALYSVYLISRKKFLFRSLAILLVCLVTLMVVSQTRQLLAGFGIAVFVMLFSLSVKGVIRLALMSGVVFIVYMCAVYFFPIILETYTVLFDSLLSDDYIESDARPLAYSIVINNFMNGNVLGSGSLSLLWKNGFVPIYGEWFFLADIGFMGTVFKYGIFAVVFYGAYLWWQSKLLIKLMGATEWRFFLGWLSTLLIALPVAALIEYRGFIAGLLLCMTYSLVLQVKK